VVSGDSVVISVYGPDAPKMKAALRLEPAMALITGLAAAGADDALASVRWDYGGSAGCSAVMRFAGDPTEDPFVWEWEKVDEKYKGKMADSALLTPKRRTITPAPSPEPPPVMPPPRKREEKNDPLQLPSKPPGASEDKTKTVT
jgi:hypothetical protein